MNEKSAPRDFWPPLYAGTVVDQPVSQTARIRAIIEALLADRFDINHVTLQVEEQQTTCSTVDLP